MKRRWCSDGDGDGVMVMVVYSGGGERRPRLIESDLKSTNLRSYNNVSEQRYRSLDDRIRFKLFNNPYLSAK